MVTNYEYITCSYTHMIYILVYVCLYIHVCVYAHAHIYTYIHVHLCLCMLSAYVYVFVYHLFVSYSVFVVGIQAGCRVDFVEFNHPVWDLELVTVESRYQRGIPGKLVFGTRTLKVIASFYGQPFGRLLDEGNSKSLLDLSDSILDHMS